MSKKADYPLTQEEFTAIYTKVPRLTVEVLIVSDDGVLLTERAIYPFEGYWHIPGGTVRYNESLEQAVQRIADFELGLQVSGHMIVGLIEYPSLDKQTYGDPRGIVALVREFSGDIELNDEASAYKWCKQTPEKMFPHQGKFLEEKGYLNPGNLNDHSKSDI